MTREEAINHLSEWMDEKMWRCFGTIDREAIGMAIKALSVDVVSREDCDQCKIDQVGVLEQQLAELRGDYETLKKAYEETLSIDVEWIPITTSEPTTAHPVLVTYKWGDDYDDYEVRDLDYWVAKSAAEEGNKQCQMFIDHVIAWSFLPQPYKER